MAGSQPLRAARASEEGVAEVMLGPVPLTGPTTHEVVLQLHEELAWDTYLPARANTWRWRIGQGVKRLFDVVVSLTLIILLSPVLLLVALVVKLTTPGSVLYEFRVLGRRARPIVAYKFRTMVSNADQLKISLLRYNEMRGPAFKMREDPRVTPIGKWLRKYSIDELPQLWSVLVGDMSLVGPRPPFAEEFADYKPWQWGKLAVTPGITCIWQVSGRSDIADFDEWATLDLQYIRDWSFWLDLKILLMTIPAVFRGRGAY